MTPAETLRLAADIDEKFRHHRGDAERLGWMPFQLADFVTLLTEAVLGTTGDAFLEIGCGPGSKALVAQEVFGLKAQGIEYSLPLAMAGATAGVQVEVADATDYPDYGEYDIVWFNRVFRDRMAQRRLEARVWAEMKPGAVVMCAHLENPPDGWHVLYDDWQARRGVWRKPAG